MNRGMGESRMKGFLRIPIEKKALLVSFATMVGLSLYRAFDYSVTGFFVADEFGYAYDAIYGNIYGNRWFFGDMNVAIFRLFNVTTIDGYALLLPFYLMFWSCLALFAFYLIMKSLDFDGNTIALSLFSSLFLVSFVLLSLGFLTEPVGLALTLVGSLFLVRFSKRRSNGYRPLLYPLSAALSFVAATYTREPYSIFLIAGAIAVYVGARGSKSEAGVAPRAAAAYLVISLLVFALPSATFLQYPNHDLADSIGSVVTDFTTLLGHGAQAQPPLVTQSNSTIQTSLSGRLMGTGGIFAFGLALGWGPIAVLLFLLSMLVILRRRTPLQRERRVALYLSLLALLSYLVVSYIFSVDSTFLSFKNYSTIIRFSDTALLAYFLIVPAGVSVIARNRTHRRAMVAIMLLFLLVAVPTYETYASSNIAYGNGNPFSFEYKTSAAQVRDYIHEHQSEGPFNIIGIPYGWIFTPGVEGLRDVTVYAPSPIPIILSHVGLFYERQLIPYLSYDEFVTQRWTTVYVYNANISGAMDQDPGYAIQFVNPSASSNSSSPAPFTVVSRQVIFSISNIVFLKIQLSWK